MFTSGTKVYDKTRQSLYGKTVGVVVEDAGPYRTYVEWPDERKTQIEKNEDLQRCR